MRKFILIGTMLLASTAIHTGVHAETARGLVMASAETNGPSQTTERSPKKLTVAEQLDAIGEKPAKPQTPPASAPLAATPAASPQISAEDAKPVAQSKPAGDTAAGKPNESRSAETSPRRSEKPRIARRHNRDWTESRVRTELARYGIYY